MFSIKQIPMLKIAFNLYKDERVWLLTYSLVFKRVELHLTLVRKMSCSNVKHDYT